VIHSFNMRSERSLFRTGPFSNRTLNGAALLSLALVALVLFTPLHTIFKLMILPRKLYLVALGLSFVPLVMMEIYKIIRRLIKK